MERPEEVLVADEATQLDEHRAPGDQAVIFERSLKAALAVLAILCPRLETCVTVARKAVELTKVVHHDVTRMSMAVGKNF